MESLSRISALLDTSLCLGALSTLLLTYSIARDLTLEASQSLGSARIVNTRPSHRDMSFLQVKKLLDSRNDREILEGLRKVISVRIDSLYGSPSS